MLHGTHTFSDSEFSGNGHLLFENCTVRLIGEEMFARDAGFVWELGDSATVELHKAVSFEHGHLRWNNGRFTAGSTNALLVLGGTTRSGVLEVLDEGTIPTFAAHRLDVPIENYARMEMSEPSVIDGGSDSTIDNFGLFVLQRGVPFSFHGSAPPWLVNHSGGVLRRQGAEDDLTIIDGYGLVNEGQIQVMAGTLQLNSLAVAADHYLRDGGQLTGPGKLLLWAGNLYLDGSTVISKFSSLQIFHGHVQGKGTLTGPGFVQWEQGTFSGNVTLGPDLTTHLKGPDGRFLKGLLKNQGRLFWDQGPLTLDDDGLLRNEGRMILSDGVQLNSIAVWTTPDLYNKGLIEIAPNTGLFTSAVTFWQSPRGRLRIKIGGYTPRTQFDRLAAQVPPKLGGTLEVQLVGGFKPVAGDVFQVMTWPSYNRQFARVVPTVIAPGLAWEPEYTPAGLNLKAIKSRTVNSPTVLTNGGFGLTLGADPASAAIIEASTNLVDWAPIATNAPFTGLWDFVTFDLTNYPHRFFRARWVP
ncbi:MAG: hypothetical protein D6743_04275 [Calditrichaeota bacterium]|nr:MAG: hypothetical protein D6743_04275 [Calditrichota bacterium]